MKRYIGMLALAFALLPTMAAPGQPAGLSRAEADALRFMREEEKLARDVYVHLGRKWGLRPFINITRSEEMHIELVKADLARFGLEDPIKSDKPGDFKTKAFRGMYRALIKRGERSAAEALRVGAEIEDLDLADLARLGKGVQNESVKSTFQMLDFGSRHHLRAFVRNLGRFGEEYKAKHISQAELEAIIGG